MNTTIKTLVITLLLTLTPLFAGSGHSHEAGKPTIERNAKIALEKLVKKGKVSKNWKDAKQISIKKQGFLSKEWVVGFRNDIEKKNIYIYLTSYGKFIGANYKGD